MDIISFSGSRVPVLTFCSHDDTHITKGWSGAPVVNADGDIVGVIAQAYGNLSHAIPSAIIRMLIETSQKDLKIGYVPRLTLQPLYEAFARRAVCPESDVTGVRVAVADVNACLCVNDIITHVCGEEVSNSNTVDWNGIRAPVQALFAGHADENVGVRVIRDGLEAEVVVKVGHADQGVAAVGMDDRMAFCANGVVFTRLSMELMGVLRDEAPWWLTGMAAEDDMDVIIVCQVEGEDSNALGFDSIWLRRAVSVDGKRVRGLQDLVGGKIVEMDNHFVVNIEGGVLRDRD